MVVAQQKPPSNLPVVLHLLFSHVVRTLEEAILLVVVVIDLLLYVRSATTSFKSSEDTR